MKILFIGKRFYTNRDALCERYGRIYQLPLHWSRMGAEVRLWLIDYHSKEKHAVSDEALKIVSSPVKTGQVIKDYLQFKKTNKPDIVIASGDAYIGYLGYRLAKQHKTKFVFDIYDKYDEFSGYIKPFGFDLYNFLLRKADICFFASDPLKSTTKSLTKQSLLVPNGIDIRYFRPMDRATARRNLGLNQNRTYIGYFGTLDVDRGIDDLIAAQEILNEQGYEIFLLLAGKSRPDLDQKLKNKHITYLGNIPYLEVPTAMACCDILALPYRRSSYLDMASSCKIAEYAAMQIPLVATDSPNLLKNFVGIASLLKPYLAVPNSPKSLANAIKLQITNKIITTKAYKHEWQKISQPIFDTLKKNS